MIRLRMSRYFAAPSGFTIMEIMIATAILTLGLVGILALFPVAIDSGKKVMERSTAVTIAKSVAEQIRAGIRNQKRIVTRGDTPYTYFLFQHDGVKDRIPANVESERPNHDYYILLPRFRPNRSFDGAQIQKNREAAVRDSYEFVYPEDDDNPNGGNNPAAADNDGDDHPDGNQILVKKVYEVGTTLPRAEDSGENVLEDQRFETLKQYSFAFSIRASKFDSNQSINPGRFEPGNELYHVRVMVFRQFTYNERKVLAERKGPEPVYELDFMVAK